MLLNFESFVPNHWVTSQEQFYLCWFTRRRGRFMFSIGFTLVAREPSPAIQLKNENMIRLSRQDEKERTIFPSLDCYWVYLYCILSQCIHFLMRFSYSSKFPKLLLDFSPDQFLSNKKLTYYPCCQALG